MKLTIDPTELQPGDVVTSISDHDISGCHCDVRVTVIRPPEGTYLLDMQAYWRGTLPGGQFRGGAEGIKIELGKTAAQQEEAS